MNVDKILEIINGLGPLLYTIIPALVAVYINVRDKVNKRRHEIEKENEAASREAYNVWEHEESQRIIRKIQDLCNFYKDKGYMDRVQYIQLENGTVATSKLCNMFISCLAEDNRFGRMPHFISKLQRISYSRVACWIDNIRALKDDAFNTALCISNSDTEECSIREILGTDVIKSSVAAPVYDPNEVLLGVCIFYYARPDYNNQHIDDEIVLINRLKSSIQSIFVEYHIERIEKKKELRLVTGEKDD